MGCSFKTDEKLYPCPCCGYLALERTGEAFHICAWQDSEEQLKDPYLTGSPNEESLWQAQRNYLRNGNSKKGKGQQCDAQKEHKRDNDWRPVIKKLDDFGSPGERKSLCVSDYSQLYYWKDTFWNSKAEAYSKKTALDLEWAHYHSIFNRSQIERSSTCGCFYCCAIFQAKDIKKWIDQGLTPICPECSIDSVLGSDSGYPISIEFLRSMRKRWF